MLAALAKFRTSMAAGAVPARSVEPLDIHQQQAKLAQVFGAAPAFAARFAVLNLVGVALIGAAWAEGVLYKPFAADTSHLCYLIAVLFAWGLVCCFRRDWPSVRFVGNALVYLGMVGTILGLIVTVGELSADGAQSFESFKQIVTSIYVGSATALYTNLLACIGYLWLGTNAHLLARQEV